jgi:hypothetical protein
VHASRLKAGYMGKQEEMSIPPPWIEMESSHETSPLWIASMKLYRPAIVSHSSNLRLDLPPRLGRSETITDIERVGYVEFKSPSPKPVEFPRILLES